MWAIFAVCFDAACHEIMEEALGEATSVARRRKLRQAQRVAATRLAAPARVGARFEREWRRRAHLFAVAGGVAARSHIAPRTCTALERRHQPDRDAASNLQLPFQAERIMVFSSTVFYIFYLSIWKNLFKTFI